MDKSKTKLVSTVKLQQRKSLRLWLGDRYGFIDSSKTTPLEYIQVLRFDGDLMMLSESSLMMPTASLVVPMTDGFRNNFQLLTNIPTTTWMIVCHLDYYSVLLAVLGGYYRFLRNECVLLPFAKSQMFNLYLMTSLILRCSISKY